jgi:hypothetical protein
MIRSQGGDQLPIIELISPIKSIDQSEIAQTYRKRARNE